MFLERYDHNVLFWPGAHSRPGAHLKAGAQTGKYGTSQEITSLPPTLTSAPHTALLFLGLSVHAVRTALSTAQLRRCGWRGRWHRGSWTMVVCRLGIATQEDTGRLVELGVCCEDIFQLVLAGTWGRIIDTIWSEVLMCLTLTVLVTTIDALRHFETG